MVYHLIEYLCLDDLAVRTPPENYFWAIFFLPPITVNWDFTSKG